MNRDFRALNLYAIPYASIWFEYTLSKHEWFCIRKIAPMSTRDEQTAFLREFFLPRNRESVLRVWEHIRTRHGGQSAIRQSKEYFRIRQLDHRVSAFEGVWNAAHRALAEMARLAQHSSLPLTYDF